MRTMTERPRHDPGDAPKLPEGLLEKALTGPGVPHKNPALLELIQYMLPHAMTLIRAAFDDANPRRDRAPTTGQMRELRNAQHVPLPDDDPDQQDPDVRAQIARRTQEAIDRATEAALRSALGSFLDHWINEFADVRSLDELAVQLIRITYNRHQRRRRGDARLGLQAGSGRGADAEKSFLDSQPDGQINPAAAAELRDFLELRRCLDDGILGGFSVRDRQIIYLHVTGHGQEEIVALVNRYGHRRGPCTLNTVNHVIETFQAQLSRLEDEDECDEEGRTNPKGNPDNGRDDERWGRDDPDLHPPEVPLAG
jgi:hypothetical protein